MILKVIDRQPDLLSGAGKGALQEGNKPGVGLYDTMFLVTVLMMMSFTCSCKIKNQPKAIYPKGTSHHMRMFRGTSTNGMKK